MEGESDPLSATLGSSRDDSSQEIDAAGAAGSGVTAGAETAAASEEDRVGREQNNPTNTMVLGEPIYRSQEESDSADVSRIVDFLSGSPAGVSKSARDEELSNEAELPGENEQDERASAKVIEEEPEFVAEIIEPTAAEPAAPMPARPASPLLRVHSDAVEDGPAARPSAAEAAATEAFTDDRLYRQHVALAERLLAESIDGGASALVGAEHQPHVTDSLMRTAVAAAAELGKQVLIIDAGFPDRAMTEGCGLSRESGLAEVTKGRIPWQQAVRSLATPGVCVLPAGRIPPPPATVMAERLAAALADLTSQWDLVLIDAGSINESIAVGVASASAAVYLVVRLGESTTAAAEEAVQKLHAAKTNLRGCIVTNAQPEE